MTLNPVAIAITAAATVATAGTGYLVNRSVQKKGGWKECWNRMRGNGNGNDKAKPVQTKKY